MADAAASWRNWSGSIAFRPQRQAHPCDTAEVQALVREIAQRGGSLRAVGAGHSSNDILRGDDTLLATDQLAGVISADRARCTAVVRPGTQLQELGRALYEHDLALPNYGDVATQTIGGAIGTGTHGSGIGQHNLSQLLAGALLVDGRGGLQRIDASDLERLRAARVALGTLGVFVEMTLRLVPAFDVQRREFACSLHDALAHFDELARVNRSLDFYWYPRRDDVKLRMVNPVGGGTHALPWARLLSHQAGYGHEVIPTHSGIPHRFEECEYALPADAGLACFRTVRARVLERWRHIVGWRVLYRTVAADDALLSAAHGRQTVTISLHQNSSLPWSDYFADIEPIFRAHGGRPHWAKKHACRADDLAPLYPRWHDFLAIRAAFDPQGVFLTPHLRELLGVAP
jgi:FAD/FMN-containing dehydrogenase